MIYNFDINILKQKFNPSMFLFNLEYTEVTFYNYLFLLKYLKLECQCYTYLMNVEAHCYFPAEKKIIKIKN